MVAKPYSGNVSRAAHFASRPSVPGVNDDHFKPDPEPDPFNPQPVPPPNQAGTVWANEVIPGTAHSEQSMITQGVSHWYNGQRPVSSGVSTANRMQAMQERFILDHGNDNYIPNPFRLFRHFSQGVALLWEVGRPAQNANEDPGVNLQYLVNGTNSYDHTNEPNEVYAGAPANVGRYRLGELARNFGLYEQPLSKNGQDASLRAYTGLSPAFPTDKPQMTNTAPYTPNSTGTAHWIPTPSNQQPSTFALPSETALTDFASAQGTFAGANPDFEDRGSF